MSGKFYNKVRECLNCTDTQKLGKGLSFLKELGVSCIDDLKVLEEKDLRQHFNLVDSRKLLQLGKSGGKSDGDSAPSTQYQGGNIGPNFGGNYGQMANRDFTGGNNNVSAPGNQGQIGDSFNTTFNGEVKANKVHNGNGDINN